MRTSHMRSLLLSQHIPLAHCNIDMMKHPSTLLETNIDCQTMEFSQEPIPVNQTSRSIRRHGPDTPFRHYTVIQEDIEKLLERKGYRPRPHRQHPVNDVVRGKWHPYFGRSAFDHADIKTWPDIRRVESAAGWRTVIPEDGSQIDNVDYIVLGTGYSWTLPFLPGFPIKNNCLPGPYLHTFQRHNPTVAFVGAVS